MTTPIYNQVGVGYNTTRAADPYLTGRFIEFLRSRPGGHYIDVGCGTGNYLAAFTKHGLDVCGIDPSTTMLAAARAQCMHATFMQAFVEHIPLPDATFDGATAILTTHHWSQLIAGLTEVRRVLKPGACLVLFTCTPEQIRSYWLREYFPRMISDSAMTFPTFSVLTDTLHKAGFTAIKSEPYHVRDDLQDQFLYSHKRRPDAYLRPEIRAGMSSFSVIANPAEVTEGLARLYADIMTGRIDTIVTTALQVAETTGDYLFVTAT